MPRNLTKNQRKSLLRSGFLTSFLAVITILLILIHTYFILHVPNIPYWDEWDLILSSNFGQPFTIQELFIPHNEHFIVATHATFRLFYELTDLNFSLLTLFGFTVYLALIIAIYHFWKSAYRSSNLALIAVLPFFSNLNLENESWAMQSCIHFSLILFFLAWLLFFRKPNSYFFRFCGCILLVLSTLSFAAAAGFLMAAFLIFGLMQFGFFGSLYRNWKLNVFSLALIAASCASVIPFLNQNPIARPPFEVFPLLTHFVSIFSLGYGITGYKTSHLLLATFLLFFTLFLYFKRFTAGSERTDEQSTVDLKLTVVFLSIGFALALISYGRYESGPAQAKASRYSELALQLFPGFLLLLVQNLHGKAKWMKIAVAIFIFALFLDNWKFTDYKSEYIARRLDGIECLKKAPTDGQIDFTCTSIHPTSLRLHAQKSRELKLQFAKDLWPPLLAK